MRSKNSKSIPERESYHLAAVKGMDCSCCGCTGPCDAHHIEQGKHWITIPLCKDCHTGKLGIHGDKTMFRAAKKTEMSCLNETIKGIYG